MNNWKDRIWFPGIIIIGFLLLTISAPLHAEEEQNVLIFHSYHPLFFATDEISRGVQDELADTIKDDHLFIEYMDSRRHYDDPEYLNQLQSLYSYKYRNRSFSAVIVADDAGLDFLQENRDSLFTDVPIVFCGINRSPETMTLSPNMTGIFEATEIKANIDLIRQLHPDLQRLVFITDRSSFGTNMKTQTQKILAEPDYASLSSEIWEDFDYESLCSDLSRLDKNSIVFFLAVVQDNRGEYFSYKYQLPLICEASSVPVYGMWGLAIGNGIIGGRMSLPYRHGRDTASMVKEILNGRSPDSFPYPVLSNSDLVFDYSVMKRFGLESEDLPEGSIILNRPESFYERYRYRIWAVLSLILIETGLLIYLSMSRSLIRRMNLNLEQKQEQISFIIREASATLWKYDPKEGQLHFFIRNCFFQDLVNRENTLSLEQYIELIYPDDRGKFRVFMEGFKSDQAKYNGVEYRILDPDGNLIWLLNRGIHEADGSITGIILNITDSRQKDIIIQRAQKMESIGVLANGLAHDFNNSLGGIIGSLDILKLKIQEDNSPLALFLKDYLAIIESSSARASELVKDLMNLSRKRTVENRPVDFKDACLNVLKLFQTGKHKAIPVYKDLPEGKAMVEGVASHIEQVILNILINAADAMEKKGGRIQDERLSLQLSLKEAKDPLLSLHKDTLPDFRFWCLKIEDTGIGMSEELQTRIFEPFFSDKKEKGNGLGLYMCYKIIDEHRGIIDVSSKPGQGCRFMIFLPELPS